MAEKFSHEIIEQNLNEIRANIECAAKESGRSADSVKLLAATKTVDADTVNFAISKGVRYIGENRVQELLEKYEKYDLANAELHFIGRLQTNKVKYIVDKVDMIESVDRVSLAKEIEKRCGIANKKMDVLLEVNIGAEEGKSGVLLENLPELVKEITALPHLCLSGLMAIPPAGGNEEENRYYFSKMHHLFLDMQAQKIDTSNVRFLSMGMSGDFETAIACGANIVRLGTVLFGKRK